MHLIFHTCIRIFDVTDTIVIFLETKHDLEYLHQITNNTFPKYPYRMISYYRYGYFCSSSTAYYLYIITHILKLGHTTSKAAHMQPISLFSLLLPWLSPSAIPLSSLFFSLRAQFKWITISSHPHPSQQKYSIDRYIS